MDDLDQREAFLKAIFAAPDDDLPRLVFADWLDERGESAWAELIRVQCELARLPQSYLLPDQLPEMERREALVDRNISLVRECRTCDESGQFLTVPTARGFMPRARIDCTATDLSDPGKLRNIALSIHPEWYGASFLKVSGGLIASAKPIHTILNSPVTQKVTHLDLSGAVHTEDTQFDSSFSAMYTLSEFTYRPAVTQLAVEALVKARECRRVTHLDLRNNDLDNDAARAIVRSTNLIRLESLRLSEGNQLRGRTWSQLVERFGEDVLQ